tara:strand:- start:151 stop:648 length:498 start_codon:yes stop_codon:yes gene_type:complete
MDLSKFKDLSDHARVWIHGFEHRLSEDEQRAINKQLGDFLPQWVSHGEPVTAAFTVLFSRFVVTAAQCQSDISGCSIDSFVQNYKMLKTAHGMNGLKGGLIYYRNQRGEIQAVDQGQFQDVVRSGGISPDCKVFNTLLSTLAQIRSGEFETNFEGSWHARSFRRG